MNFVIKYEQKLKLGPVILSERYKHVWSTVFEKLQIFVKVVLHMWKTDDHKFSICTFSGIAEVLGAMATGLDPVRWTGSDTALGYTQSVTGTGLCRSVQEVSPLMGSGSVGPGRTGLHSAEGRVQGLGVDFSCEHPAALPGSLFPLPLAGWDPHPGCACSTLLLSPKTKPLGKAGIEILSKDFHW